jgi:hypothetical protein
MKLVLFYPDPPEQLEGHTLSKTIEYFDIIGYNFTENIDDDWTIGVHWDLQDVNETPQALLEDKRPVLNRYLNNITKSHVDKIFAEVFGYSSFADTTQHGFCVRKSERQSAHDGVITKMPCTQEDGFIYQKWIDNRMSIDMIYDIRVPFFMGAIPLLFIKGKSIEGTFENTLSAFRNYFMAPPEEWLTAEEIQKVVLFSAEIGLDLGEIDLLRDNSTGKLYIIDVNNIPGGSVFNYIEKGEEVKNQLAWIFNSVLP